MERSDRQQGGTSIGPATRKMLHRDHMMMPATAQPHVTNCGLRYVFRGNGFSVDFAVKSIYLTGRTAMTIVEYRPDEDEILDFVDSQIRHLRDDGVETKYIIAGPAAYGRLCRAISTKEKRGKGRFETYNFIAIVLDPFRSDEVCVVPDPAECATGVETIRL